MNQNYANEKSFSVYIDYLALKRHFTTKSYDYHKYNGKVKTSFDKFQTRNDLLFFHKLSQKNDNHNIILSNMIKNPNIWIRDLCEEESHEVYLSWKKRFDAFSYHLKQDLNKLDDNYKANFAIHNGNYPHLMNLYLQKKISLETFSILTNSSNIFEYWESQMNDKILSKDIMDLSKKYFPFIEKNIGKKFVSIVKEHFF